MKKLIPLIFLCATCSVTSHAGYEVTTNESSTELKDEVTTIIDLSPPEPPPALEDIDYDKQKKLYHKKLMEEEESARTARAKFVKENEQRIQAEKLDSIKTDLIYLESLEKKLGARLHIINREISSHRTDLKLARIDLDYKATPYSVGKYNKAGRALAEAEEKQEKLLKEQEEVQSQIVSTKIQIVEFNDLIENEPLHKPSELYE